MEINEHALLAIIAEHLEVTERLLEHYSKLGQDASLPMHQGSPTLQDMHASTRSLRQRVQAILDRK